LSYLPPPSTLPPGSIVDSYRRDSGGSRQDKSTGQQLAEIEAFCNQHALIHRIKFVDDAKSGGSTAGRDDFNRMLAEYEIPANRPRGLLLWNYARFARDIDDAQFNKLRLRQWGIVIHSFNDQIPEGEYGRVIEFLIDVANEEKRKQTSTDAKRGLKDLVERYGCVPGTPPRGFKRTPVNLGPRRDKTEHIAHRWDPDPEFIPRIKKAFELKAAGATLLRIHNETHLYSSLNSYKTFFENKLYIGTLIFGNLAIENYCPPIIDLPTWDAVQKVLALHSNRQHVSSPTSIHPRRKSSATYLLSGIAFCSRCQSPLWGMTSGQRDGSYYRRYACTRAKRNRTCDLQPIPAISLEKAVIQKLTAFFENPHNLQALLEEDGKAIAELSSKNKTVAKEIQKQITPLRRSIANITEAIAQRGHSKAMLEKLADLEAQETALQSQLQSAKTDIPTAEAPLTIEEITFLSKRLVARLQSKDYTTTRNILLGAISLILIDRTPQNAFGIINIHAPKVSPPPNDDLPFGGGQGIITASTPLHPVGAPLYKRSIPFEFTINKKTSQIM